MTIGLIACLADVFLSASEDGTVREFDVRQRPAAAHRDALAGDGANVLGGCLLLLRTLRDALLGATDCAMRVLFAVANVLREKHLLPVT
jgi:hypothetical protein